ncbi:MAG: hypothetical protein EPN82_13140 [Bacteroidetes bacterium]|nr:MAG: hypothetical protein EPN82_13140 [Bacteroidota bacterium]
MKKLIIVLIMFFSTEFLYCEDSQNGIDSLLKLDFSVPDIPALKALGNENSTILRPTTSGELGVQLSKFFDGSSLSLPSAFAIEVAPFLLGNQPDSINGFIDRGKLCDQFKNNFRVSIGSLKDTIDNSTNIAIGFRWTFDINLRDKLKKENERLEITSDLNTQYENEYAYSIGHTYSEVLKNDTLYKLAKKYARKRLKAIAFNKLIDTIWNTDKLDIAFAGVFNSKDSTGIETKFKSINAWITYSQGTCLGNWGQLLIGGNLRIVNNDLQDNQLFNYGIGVRFYVGANKLKAFIESGYDYDELKSHRKYFQINSGVELNLSVKTWIVYNIGWEREVQDGTNSSHFITNLDFKYNIAELINLFI